jgi:solute carrier family 35 protein E3
MVDFSELITLLYAVGNVTSSVTLVLLNKRVFSNGFFYPMTLSFFHFVFTIGFYEALRVCGVYVRPEQQMPRFEKFKVAFAGFASIGFMNLSLTYNSVGFYQVTKLIMVPVTLAINSLFYNVTTNGKVKVSLLLVIAGVGVATVTDVQLKPLGFGFGCCAVLATAMFQIFQGTKQKEFGLSGTQLQAAIAPWQSTQALIVAGAAECVCWSALSPCETAIDYFAEAAEPKHAYTLALVLGTCFVALLVNFTSFGLIGKTGPITFQVVGHAKTCLVLVGGYVLFPAKNMDVQQFYNNIAGVSIAFLGCVLYGNIKYASQHSREDCIDCSCPGVVAQALDPSKYATEEEVGLTVAK